MGGDGICTLEHASIASRQGFELHNHGGVLFK
jgi:hypothetical protein